MWASFCWPQKYWVCHLTLNTVPSSPRLIPMPHSTIGLIAGSVECSPSSPVAGFPWWASPVQGKDFLQVCDYLCQQQSYVMPLLNLMTSSNPKMDWCNTWYHNYGHNRLLTLIILCLGLMIVLLHRRRQMGLVRWFFYWMFIKYGMRSYG